MAAAFLLLWTFLNAAAAAAQQNRRPNFIILQPDDLRFQERWNPPPHHPNNPQITRLPSAEIMPNIERLRQGGLQMTQAYTCVMNYCARLLVCDTRTSCSDAHTCSILPCIVHPPCVEHHVIPP